MKAQLFDTQDHASLRNGRVLESPQQLRAALEEMQSPSRAPFFMELVGDNGRQLLLGLGGADGCVQFSSADGAPPYLMAVGQYDGGDGPMEFMMGGTATPVSRRYSLPLQVVTGIAMIAHRFP